MEESRLSMIQQQARAAAERAPADAAADAADASQPHLQPLPALPLDLNGRGSIGVPLGGLPWRWAHR